MASADRTRNLTLLARDGLLFGVPLLPYIVMIGLYGRGAGAFDLHVFWSAAQAVAHGNSPYDPAGVAHARALVEAGSKHEASAAWAVYPPAAYAALVPLGLLPWHVAATIGIAGIAAAGFFALRIMGVRDWRCYLVAAGSVPFAISILEGAISTLLMLGVALAWRGRIPATASAAELVAKLFVWPLAFVVAGLHGYRRAGMLLAGACAVAVGSWAIIGFADLRQYPRLLSDLSAAEARNSFSTAGFAHALGASPALGEYAGLAFGLTLAVLAFRAARAGQRDAAFTLAIVASLVASPIVWVHYFVLVFLPLAARAPRFNALWLVALPMWFGSPIAAKGHLLPFLATWPCIAIVVFVALLPARAGATAQESRPELPTPPVVLADADARAAA
jgi:alpha-1,2-mannosyltransferase